MFQSNGLLATHEQEGVQGHLDCLDSPLIPDQLEAGFVTLRIGDEDLRVTTPLGQDYGLGAGIDDLGLNDLDSPPDATNRIWDVPLFDLDPNLGDPSTIFDAPGFDYRVGISATGAIDARPLTGLDRPSMPTGWEAWRSSATNFDERLFGDFFVGTAVGSWSDWEERMWYLINLFRIIHTDNSLQGLPQDDRLGGDNTSVNIVSVNRLSLSQ